MNFVEYEVEFESLQLLKRDNLRLHNNKISLNKNINCLGNDLMKLLSHIKSLNDDESLKTYRRIIEIIEIHVQNLVIKALIYF